MHLWYSKLIETTVENISVDRKILLAFNMPIYTNICSLDTYVVFKPHRNRFREVGNVGVEIMIRFKRWRIFIDLLSLNLVINVYLYKLNGCAVIKTFKIVTKSLSLPHSVIKLRFCVEITCVEISSPMQL